MEQQLQNSEDPKKEEELIMTLPSESSNNEDITADSSSKSSSPQAEISQEIPEIVQSSPEIITHPDEVTCPPALPELKVESTSQHETQEEIQIEINQQGGAGNLSAPVNPEINLEENSVQEPREHSESPPDLTTPEISKSSDNLECSAPPPTPAALLQLPRLEVTSVSCPSSPSLPRPVHRRSISRPPSPSLAEIPSELRCLRGELTGKVALFNKQVDQHLESQKWNPFSNDQPLPRVHLDKNDPNYGRPIAGSKSDLRGQKAMNEVSKEILELCEVIDMSGSPVPNDPQHTYITFGELFNIYVCISNKVVGILLRARKHHLLHFEGECLFQRRDDDVPIFLLKTIGEIRELFKSGEALNHPNNHHATPTHASNAGEASS